ncbi:hypothetical protein [Shewanella sp. 1180_01]|uniref:hypothetical protein n=1 Tax=Shewanella sp. 1180_01 TaxID=2604451 RepID=UPI00406461C2
MNIMKITAQLNDANKRVAKLLIRRILMHLVIEMLVKVAVKVIKKGLIHPHDLYDLGLALKAMLPVIESDDITGKSAGLAEEVNQALSGLITEQYECDNPMYCLITELISIINVDRELTAEIAAALKAALHLVQQCQEVESIEMAEQIQAAIANDLNQAAIQRQPSGITG